MACPCSIPVSRHVLRPKHSTDNACLFLTSSVLPLPCSLGFGMIGTRSKESLMSFGYLTATCKAKQESSTDSEGPLNPVGFFKDRNISSKAFAQYLRERYKALKDLKVQITRNDDSLLEFASAYEFMGLHRNPFHAVELIEWAPAAYYCSVVGDFNDWTPRKEYTGEEYLGHDDLGNWRLVIGDKLREGEEKDLVVQEYNYDEDYDLGDTNPDWDAIMKEIDEGYWEPGEDEYMCDPVKKFEEIHARIFGSNPNPIYEEEPSSQLAGEESDEEVPKYRIPSARARYEAWRASQPVVEGQLPPIDVIDDGTDYKVPTIIDDPVWRERVIKKGAPMSYMKYLVCGRKAWLKKYIPTVQHGSQMRLFLQTPEGPLERVPAWATYVTPDTGGKSFVGVMWDPPRRERYQWQHRSPKTPHTLRIYECHVGISGEEPRVSTFNDFIRKVLPHVKKCGYNVLQLIGIQEHVDYASAGYKVSSLFAVSSRFGNPEDFKRLVDIAHGMGLLVFMDIVQSYAASEEMSGLSSYDGANDCYFYSGKRGRHKHTGTRIFNYSEYEVKRFLLSNLKWWVEEYRVDGFHFHSLQSMLYTHNGFSEFKDGLNDYCNQYVDKDAVLYVILANELLHNLSSKIVTIAEDASLYPGLCEPTTKGGLGFDYFANMVPSKMWSYLIQNVPYDQWSMSQIVGTLIDSQSAGKALVYCENHAQTIFEKRPLIEALFNYDASSLEKGARTERGVQLHKIIRLITFSLGGSAYLNFMGNEFGHPECVEFPKSQNPLAFDHARRRWDLLADGSLHSQLADFDKALMGLDRQERLLANKRPSFYRVDDPNQVVVFSRGRLLFVFNFHPTACYENVKIGVQETGEYERILDTDDAAFGGQGYFSDLPKYLRSKVDKQGEDGISLLLLLPAGSAQVYKLARIWEPDSVDV